MLFQFPMAGKFRVQRNSLGQLEEGGPTSTGVWGLKYIFHFGKYLAAKSFWNFLTKDSHWKQILVHKYIASDSVVDWIRKETKWVLNASNYWEVLTVDFPLVGAFLVWKIGNESEIRIGKDE